MRVDVLGPVAVSDDAATTAIGGPRQRAVLAVLAVLRGRVVMVDQLVDAVWGASPPRTAEHTLHNYVLRLRRLGVAIERVGGGYRLDSPTDVDEVRTAMRDATEYAGPERAQALTAALGLVRGEPAAGLPDSEIVRADRETIVELVESLREDAAAAQLELAVEPAAAGRLVAGLRGLVAAYPYRERRWELLVLGLYRAGRQSEALEAFAEARELLDAELGIEPSPGLRQLQQAVLSQDPSLSQVAVGGRALPGLTTRLIGRSGEQAELAAALAASRLVSIVGPLGAGKTRLALEHARADEPVVWFVPLEGLPDRITVAEAVLAVVAPASRSADPLDGVVAGLGRSAGLLVLDSAEHRVEEVAPLVSVLLDRADAVRILVTTRQRLQLRDEAVVGLDSLRPSESRALLLDRARLGAPGFELSTADLGAADRLCGLVDGLPLGIELVARHLRLMSVRELADRVDADLDRWTEGAADASAGLVTAVAAGVAELPTPVRLILARLSVFAAEVDLSLAHDVVAPERSDDEVFDALATLVDRSLLQVRSGPAGVRYAMLLSVRRYCLGLLSDDDRRALESTYLDAVLRRAERLAAGLRSPERAGIVAILDADAPHLEAALAGSLDLDRPLPALRAAIGLSDYWLSRRPSAGMTWLGRLLAAAEVSGVERASVLLQMGHLAYWLTDFDRGVWLLDEARTLLADTDEALLLGRVLRRMGAIAAARDDIEVARENFESSLLVLRTAGEGAEAAISALHLGSLLADESRTDEALPVLIEARDALRAAGDPLSEGHALSALSLAWWKSGDLPAARGAAEQAVARFRDLGHLPGEGVVAYRLAAICRGLGDLAEARRYADLSLADGQATETRTTTALARLALARLDLDAGEIGSSGAALTAALDGLDVAADRWVLAEALEVVGRLQLARGLPAAAALAAAADLRELIGQPAPPVDAAELAELTARAGSVRASDGTPPAATNAAALRAWALDLSWGASPAVSRRREPLGPA